ncbi:MAG: sulfatase [Verrucomicrobia bacterium]|nr:sulfatase [Verrucomicrobiota bacterium]
MRANLLLIVADDLGVHQLGCLNPGGPAFFRSPCLDRFAAEGISFTQAYATAPVCSPSRASLYTGLHPARLHLTDFIPGSRVTNPPLLPPAWQQGLPVAAVTLGDALRAHGYETAHFGKWHLAPDYHYVPGRPMDPESQGFGEVLVTRKPAPHADPERDPHHIEALTDRAIEYCTRPRPAGRPFFCVLAHNALHRPELAPAARVAAYAAHPAADPHVNRPVLAALLEQLDTATGRLLDALRASGRDRDTLVVFTSDHGALGGSAQRKPLRGAKADLYEGGIRVPLLLRWPGHIAPGQARAAPVCNADLFPTLLGAAGAPIAGTIDGRDLWPLLRDAATPAPHEALSWHYPHYHHLGPGPCGAIRVGDYKLVEWFAPPPRLELFHLAADPGESRNLADAEPARRDDLLRRLHAWRRAVDAQEMRPNPNYDAGAPTRLSPPAGDNAPDPTA